MSRCCRFPSKYSTCGRSSSAFCRSGFITYFCSFLSASPAASPSFCPSLRCCLAGGHWGQIIILKLKWAVWTQNWGMNCLIELAAVAAFPEARTELFALSSSHPHLGAWLLSITLLFSALLRMTKVPCRQTPVKNISIHGFRPVKDEEQHFDTGSCLKGSISV